MLKSKQLNVLFVNRNAQNIIYQELSNKWTAIEIPTWSLLLAEGCRQKGFGVAILDCDAEQLSLEDSIKRIKEYDPRLVCFVVYGSQPNSGTFNFEGNLNLASQLKKDYSQYKIGFIGSHISSLPKESLEYDCIDYVFPGDGFLALTDYLEGVENNKNLGLGYKENDSVILNNGRVVENLDRDLPGYAFDLIDFKRYRPHIWHNLFSTITNGSAAIYTSLGCPKKCLHCMINILNRIDMSDGIHAANSANIKFWSTNTILGWYTQLIEKYGITTIRISDELFFLKPSHYKPLFQGIIDRGWGKHLLKWVYARIDTTRPKDLDLFREAGVRWLAFGIESINEKVQREIDKDTFEEVDVRSIIKQTGEHGINTIANYIYGLPSDTHESMRQSLDAAMEMNTEYFNLYAAMSIPGSPLYYQAIKEGWDLPQTFSSYSFHSYDSLPCRNENLTAAEILKARDEAWLKYVTNPAYLSMIQSKFGEEARSNIVEMSKVKLARKLLGDPNPNYDYVGIPIRHAKPNINLVEVK